ncbi:MAG: DUF11 domain-containing protein, partial [Methanobacteriota archaeon]
HGSAYGERMFNVNLSTSNAAYAVSASERAAQSFTPAVSFLLYNVTIQVQNVAPKSDSLTVTIQRDSAGVPNGVVLATSTQAQQGSGWMDFSLTPRPVLSAGQTYWIVAGSTALAGEGYDWFHSNTDTVPGEAKQDLGSGWTVSVATDLTFITYGIPTGAEIAVGLSADRLNPEPGGTLVYTVYMNNTGTADAMGAWVNVTLPPQVSYVSDTSSSLSGTNTGPGSWTFGTLANGPHAFTISVALSPAATANTVLATVAHLDYIDGSGANGPSSTATASVTVLLPGGIPPAGPLASLIVLAAAVAVPVAGYALWRRRRSSIEEVFLVHRHGLLLCHLSRRMRAHQDKDHDVLGAMLTVVQEFVRDSFRYGKDRDLDRIEFGSYRVLIERGRYAYLAAAFSGKDSPEVRRKMRRTLRAIEQEYGTDLEEFDGSMEPLLGVRDIVARLVHLS